MNEVRWKLKTFSGSFKDRTGYVLEQLVFRGPGDAHHPDWECVLIEDTNETLVFDQYPLGQAVPKIKFLSELTDADAEKD